MFLLEKGIHGPFAGLFFAAENQPGCFRIEAKTGVPPSRRAKEAIGFLFTLRFGVNGKSASP
jgi:hypothetical protein